MRILLLSPVFPPATGGIETLAGRLASHLQGEVRVVTLAPGESAAQAAPRIGGESVVRVRNLPKGGRRSILRVNLRAAMEGIGFRPDIVLVLHVKLAPAATLIGRRLKIPYVQYVHAREIREVPQLARLAVENAAAVIAVSAYSASLAEEVGATAGRISVIHNGIDLPAARRGTRSPTPTLVTVSRLEDRYKGHDIVLEALPAIRRAIPDVHWNVIGDGGLRSELERRAQQLGITDCVTFMGRVDDAMRDRELDAAWAYIMLSRQPPGARAGEGFGIAYVEAGAHSLPTIAGRTPGVVDAVQHERTGILVDPNDPDEVAAATVRLLGDQPHAQRLGAGGRARAEQLQWPDVAGRVQALLEHALAARSPTGERPRIGWGWIREMLMGSSTAR